MKQRACQALIAQLKAGLRPEHAVIDATGRTERFEENLVSSLSVAQIDELRDQLAAGDGRELEPGAEGERPDGHAAHSSAALAFNEFGAWLGHEEDLVIDGVSGFTEPLKVEARQRIFRGGRAPNLDALAAGPDVVVGVESKLTETLARHGPAAWSDAYRRKSCRALLSDGWLEVLDAAREGEYTTHYLDADQLLKHALGLSNQNPGRQLHLVYLYWEPVDGDQFTVVHDHRKEVEGLLKRVGDASPQLHALTHAQLWREWGNLSEVAWVSAHVDLLRQRYEVCIDSARNNGTLGRTSSRL